MKAAALTGLLLLIASGAASQPRMTTDFELATVETVIARERNPLRLAAAWLNLGDLRLARSEASLAREAYETALSLIRKERLATRSRSDLTGYALATAYKGLGEAKLGRTSEAFHSFEEALRYSSDAARIWNLFSSAMNVAGQTGKSVASARNAVAIAETEGSRANESSALLDLNVYRYSLASALESQGTPSSRDEAITLLRSVVDSLTSPSFERLREEISRSESFEVYSSAQGGVDAYISLLVRSRLRLARAFEERGDPSSARRLYEDVVDARSDDATALTALARLSSTANDRSRFFGDAFDANPFSISLMSQYESYLRDKGLSPDRRPSTGSSVRGVIEAIVRADYRRALDASSRLSTQFPASDAIRYLKARAHLGLGDRLSSRAVLAEISSVEWKQQLSKDLSAAGEQEVIPSFLLKGDVMTRDPSEADIRLLASLLQGDRLTPPQRKRLDEQQFSSLVRFDPTAATVEPGTSAFRSGRLGDQRFRFGAVTTFAGSYEPDDVLRLDYRILGVTQSAIGVELLLEPLKVGRP
ncbi:MAG TPA: tetratricopeptide repeat protein [Thermoanaerobaculia bacterium]|nr:tetratricopeptide repeat protein [Thermoanaerobaculia bacterium]